MTCGYFQIGLRESQRHTIYQERRYHTTSHNMRRASKIREFPSDWSQACRYHLWTSVSCCPDESLSQQQQQQRQQQWLSSQFIHAYTACAMSQKRTLFVAETTPVKMNRFQRLFSKWNTEKISNKHTSALPTPAPSF